ncbi:hypothetical protein C8R44DRAFT_874686 [Mycena epipterygia]|nr:hypothetical protein C8R44DRAFT_874686 [Mycena epipterygia]
MDEEWVVLIINDKKLERAFSTPGLICVSTGFMPLAQNEEGLAAILAHANIVGLKYLSQACYDPGAASQFPENMEKVKEVRMCKFLTHQRQSGRL